MTTFIAANLTLLLLVVVVGLLERTHRRTLRSPHGFFGSEPTDADLRRILHDLDVHP